MNYRTFLQEITADTQFLNEDDITYLKYHSRRLYLTYKMCIKYLKKGNRVLSIGASTGGIEKMLTLLGIEVTVVDFDIAIEKYREYNKYLGIKVCSGNVFTDSLNLQDDYFDFLLCSEVIEHIPMAPHMQLLNARKYLKPNATVIISTPNLGSILHIGRLLVMLPILEIPEKTFGEVNIENSGTHRREYMLSEVINSYEKAGFSTISTKYFYYTYRFSFSLFCATVFGGLIPRFRPGMLLVGKKMELLPLPTTVF